MIFGQDVRLLRALNEAEAMSSVRTVDPAYALAAAARAHVVPELSVARLWLTKAIHCSRARAMMASMTQADADLDEEIR